MSSDEQARTDPEEMKETVRFWRERSESIDQRWQSYHDVCVDAFRKALGMEAASIPQMAAEIRRLQGDMRRFTSLLIACRQAAKGLGIKEVNGTSYEEEECPICGRVSEECWNWGARDLEHENVCPVGILRDAIKAAEKES